MTVRPLRFCTACCVNAWPEKCARFSDKPMRKNKEMEHRREKLVAGLDPAIQFNFDA
jgi:hypothetical protein